MEKEFIPYNLAKQIKQLGFKQECFGYYVDVEVSTPFLVKNIVSDDQGGYFTLAPTFSQAFRWFRDKYEIYGMPISYFGGSRYGLEDKNKNYHNNLEFKTHEEAELECLKKLIEIIKQQLKNY